MNSLGRTVTTCRRGQYMLNKKWMSLVASFKVREIYSLEQCIWYVTKNYNIIYTHILRIFICHSKKVLTLNLAKCQWVQNNAYRLSNYCGITIDLFLVSS